MVLIFSIVALSFLLRAFRSSSPDVKRKPDPLESSLVQISSVLWICSSKATSEDAWNSKKSVGFSSIFVGCCVEEELLLLVAASLLKAATLVASSNSHRTMGISQNFNMATVFAASAKESKTQMAATTCSGMGCNLTVTEVMTPSVPCRVE